MRALVVINPHAGPGRVARLAECRALAAQVLTRHGYQTRVEATSAPGEARAMAARACAEGAAVVVAWGGDGTVNEVGSALAFSNTALGIVPGGSGNGLARDLGLPMDPERALDAAASGAARRIDAGELDGSLFFNVAGVGLDGLIARRLASPASRRGLPAYVVAALREWPGYVPRRYRVTGDIELEAPALFVAVANSRQYGFGGCIAPAARLDDGYLDLVIVGRHSLWQVARRLPPFFRGTLREGRGLTMRRIQQATIHAEGEMPLHVDGEPRAGRGSVSVRTHPGALRVMAL
jgi:YegS/Rv2252/BmrU family lipid kinase